jgi:WD40 repeat protein
VEHTAFNPLGGTKRSNHLLATAAGRTLRIWSAKGVLIREYPEHASTVSAIAWKPGKQELVSASYGTLAMWVPSQDSALKSFHWKGSILSIACSPNDKFIATGDQDCTVHFWYTKTGRDLQMAGYPAKVLQLSWDATSRFLATGGSDTVIVWDCQRSPAGSTPLQCEGHEDFITALAYQHRGSLLASADATGLTALWHPVASSKPQAFFKMPDEAVALSWNSTDDALVVASRSGQISVLECASYPHP